jgi:uncharacterized protein involved in type VI secretion and phage assembly
MSREYGVVIGEVVSVKDPQDEGRVKVKFPILPGRNESHWAPVATLMSGSGRGALFLPEKGDEVLVAFQNGDVNHPYILGFLWNGADKPPASGINENVRRLRTVSGHTIDFDDNGGEEKLVIRSKSGHTVALTDAPSASVRIESAAGHRVELDDAAGSAHAVATTAGGQKVTLADGPSASAVVETTGGQKLTLSDAPASATVQTAAGQKVTLKGAPPTATVESGGNSVALGPAGVTVTASGPLTLNCAQATITASSALMVNAPTTIFSGPVITPNLVTSSVVSPLYTPGVGNLLGL